MNEEQGFTVNKIPERELAPKEVLQHGDTIVVSFDEDGTLHTIAANGDLYYTKFCHFLINGVEWDQQVPQPGDRMTAIPWGTSKKL